MKKRLGILMLAFMMAVSMAGCSKKGGSDGAEKASEAKENPEKVLKKALKEYYKEKMKAEETMTVTSYDDETQEEEYYTAVFDEKKEIIERISMDEGESEEIYHTFNVKEKDGYSVYVKDDLTGGEWKYYPESKKDDGESEYEYWKDQFYTSISEEKGFSNVEYAYKGEEEVAGKKANRIEVTADQMYDSGEISDGKTTRKGVLEEYGWSEEEVKLVDGFSEILDNYVKARTKSEGATTIECTFNAWISVEDGQIIKTRFAQGMQTGQDEATKEAISRFEEDMWQVDTVHQNIEEGMSPEEAKEILENNLKAMKNPTEEVVDDDASADEAGEEAAIEDDAEVTKIVITKRIMTGKDCPKMEALPEKYEKITEEDYFNGGMDTTDNADFFMDGDEFEDEFE